jgi:hypothetical protein
LQFAKNPFKLYLLERNGGLPYPFFHMFHCILPFGPTHSHLLFTLAQDGKNKAAAIALPVSRDQLVSVVVLGCIINITIHSSIRYQP